LCESAFPENAIVRRVFIQLPTRADGNGVLVQHSIRTIKSIGNVLINLKLRVFRLPVFVKKHFVLKFLIAFCRISYSRMHIPCSVLYFLLWPVFLCHIFHIISNTAPFKKKLNREFASWCFKHFLILEELTDVGILR